MELCLHTLKEIIIKLNEELNQKPFKFLSQLGYYIASELFIEVLECVSYLHKQNIIHRDLKPSNILVTDGSNGRFLKLADFGLAVFHNSEDQTHTQGLGTMKYIAPEVLSSRNYDEKSDIYSLGVIIQDLFNIDLNS
jgi:calcium/calmodulin-dependent protein kinase I